MVAHFSKILLAQAHKRCSIKLRIAADEVMCTRHEFFSVYVSPWLHIVVPAVHDNGARVPVLLFARHEVSAFEKQNFLTRWREPVGQRSASRPASNDDHIVVTVCAHECTSNARCHGRVCLFPQQARSAKERRNAPPEPYLRRFFVWRGARA